MLRALPLVVILAASPALGADRGSMQHEDTFRDAATAPLEDLNLKQLAIPDVLKRAVASPYDMTGLNRCEPIAAEIGRLDAALGPDLDEAPPPPDKRGVVRKLGSKAREAGVAEVRGRTRDLLPFRGWVRKLTGAERHDKQIAKAIQSGGIRRGYLKGVGMRMNCAPPAAPSWFVPAPPPEPPRVAGLWERIVDWFWSWWPF